MNRSAQPFPSGARTNAGELSMPRKRSSLWKSRAMYWLPWSWRTERPRATSFAKPPKWRRTPWRSGSRGSKRVASREGGGPEHSAEQWSTATNTAAWPSPVIVAVRSVPHIVSIVSGMIVPSWLRGPRGVPVREGASRPCSRIGRSTRRREVRTPPWRNLAHTLRWPSAWNGLAASTARTASRSSASGIGPTGPGRRGAARDGGRRSSGRRPRRDRPGPNRTARRPRVRSSGSSPRPPSGQMAAGLQGGDLLGQQLALEHRLAELRPQPVDLQVLGVGRPGRERRPAAANEGVPPAPERARRHPQRARDRLQALAAQEPQHGFPLARPGHPSAPAGSDPTRIRRRRHHGPPPLRTRSAYEVSRSTVGRRTPGDGLDHPPRIDGERLGVADPLALRVPERIDAGVDAAEHDAPEAAGPLRIRRGEEVELVVPLPVEGEGAARPDDLEADVRLVAGRRPGRVHRAVGAVSELDQVRRDVVDVVGTAADDGMRLVEPLAPGRDRPHGPHQRAGDVHDVAADVGEGTTTRDRLVEAPGMAERRVGGVVLEEVPLEVDEFAQLAGGDQLPRELHAGPRPVDEIDHGDPVGLPGRLGQAQRVGDRVGERLLAN